MRAGAETNYSQFDVRVTGDLGAALGIPVAQCASAVPDRFVTPVWKIERRHDGGTGAEQYRRAWCRPGSSPGAATTGTDQIVVCASVDGVATLPNGGVAPCNANEKAAKLTISQQPLFVRISTNNEIAKVNNNLDYEKLFSIYVTNAAGQGVAGAPVSIRLLPLVSTTRAAWPSRWEPAGCFNGAAGPVRQRGHELQRRARYRRQQSEHGRQSSGRASRLPSRWITMA